MASSEHHYRNVSFATAACVREVLARGEELRVRGYTVRELTNCLTILQRPLERCLFVPGRRNNICATIAETFWVLAGRNDINWLKRYLPRAGDYSDDNVTWRAAYGPRLRNWRGTDQLKAARDRLLEEPLTRRAVMTLFDPALDFADSKDIPCNNWLHWLVRKERLHLTVVARSSDVLWGFSGINSFEWSVLHEIMAYWIGVPVGDATYLASSMHLYERHFEQAERMVQGFRGVTCYDFGVQRASFATPWDTFEKALVTWFALEQQISRFPDVVRAFDDLLADPLMNGSLHLVRLYLGEQGGWGIDRLKEELVAFPDTDLTAAAYEFFGRRHPKLLEAIPQPSVAAFINAYSEQRDGATRTFNWISMKQRIKALHHRKSTAYGDAWKRRGELTSVLANVARKVDRLEQFAAANTILDDESSLDTAVDLLVYLLKYRLFLMDLAPRLAQDLLPNAAQRPYSDHHGNVDLLLDELPLPRLAGSSRDAISAIAAEFEKLHLEASASGSLIVTRMSYATELSKHTLELIVAFVIEQPDAVQKFEAVIAGQGPGNRDASEQPSNRHP